jgi:hypothetical protein
MSPSKTKEESSILPFCENDEWTLAKSTAFTYYLLQAFTSIFDSVLRSQRAMGFLWLLRIGCRIGAGVASSQGHTQQSR